VRLLVAGAGYVGGELAALLARAGHHVLALRRTPQAEVAHSSGAAVRAPSTPVRWLACDLADPRAVGALELEPLDALVYLVGADARDDASYRRAYVDGLANLLARLAANRSLQRVLFVSSTSVYAQDDGARVDELSATVPRGFSGRRVLEGEAIARGARCTAVALRLGGIYGPGRTSLIERARSGEAQLPRAPHFTNRIHRDDAARACAYLLTLPTPEPVYLGVDHEPADQAEVLRWIAGRLGVAPPRGDYDANLPATGKRCSSARLRVTGFQFHYPTFREGYGSLIATSP
jgi:nucleoside-diphosphate-sugar epimerase